MARSRSRAKAREEEETGAGCVPAEPLAEFESRCRLCNRRRACRGRTRPIRPVRGTHGRKRPSDFVPVMLEQGSYRGRCLRVARRKNTPPRRGSWGTPSRGAGIGNSKREVVSLFCCTVTYTRPWLRHQLKPLSLHFTKIINLFVGRGRGRGPGRRGVRRAGFRARPPARPASEFATSPELPRCSSQCR